MDYFVRYIDELGQLARPDDSCVDGLAAMNELLLKVKADSKKVMIVGNGGSAAIASHVATDFTKNTGIRCVNMNEAGLITCFANDYGYEHWLERGIGFYGDAGDLLIAVSSSGQSPNILNACGSARKEGFAGVVTLSGFASDNPLRSLGDVNLWVNSSRYNYVELTHLAWLLASVDYIIENMNS